MPGPRARPRPARRARSEPAAAWASAAAAGWRSIDDADRSPTDVATVQPAARLRGELRLPGDKSISHRALMLAALAAGESRISGAGDGADVRSTAGVMRALGATRRAASRDDGRTGRLPGRLAGRRRPPRTRRRSLDCGNSGTSLRLIAGMLAGLPMTAVLDGDGSLRRRPVARIIEPLRSMGAVLHGATTTTPSLP